MKIQDEPLVSVLMTAYNREKYIGEAIESVLASLYTNFELIIVDDCSSDKTVEIARDFSKKDNRIRLFINERNLGDYNNRNKAASYAQGKYIMYLDSDDLMYDFSLFHAVRFMEIFPEAGFGMYSKPDIKMPYPVCIDPKQIYEEHFFSDFGHFSRSPASAIIKLDVFRSLNGFSGKRFVGDMEFWMKIARTHKMVKHCVPNFWYRNDNTDKEAIYEKNTSQLRKNISIDALMHSDCPLAKKDAFKVVKNLNKSKYQVFFKRLVNKVKNTFINK